MWSSIGRTVEIGTSNLQSFAMSQKKQAPMALVEVAANDDDLEKVFKQFDSNGDGKISPSEMGGLLRSIGSDASPAEIQQIMEEMDSDRDGFIDIKEFAEFVRGGDGEAQLKDAFNMYDLDGNGRISAKELHQVMKKMGMKCSFSDCTKMIRSVDVDRDGCVNFNEFKTMMNKK